MEGSVYTRLLAMTKAANDAIETCQQHEGRADELARLRTKLAQEAAAETLRSVAAILDSLGDAKAAGAN